MAKMIVEETNVVAVAEKLLALDDTKLEEEDFMEIQIEFASLYQQVIDNLAEIKQSALGQGYIEDNLLDYVYYKRRATFKGIIHNMITMQRLYKKYSIGDKG